MRPSICFREALQCGYRAGTRPAEGLACQRHCYACQAEAATKASAQSMAKCGSPLCQILSAFAGVTDDPQHSRNYRILNAGELQASMPRGILPITKAIST